MMLFDFDELVFCCVYLYTNFLDMGLNSGFCSYMSASHAYYDGTILSDVHDSLFLKGGEFFQCYSSLLTTKENLVFQFSEITL